MRKQATPLIVTEQAAPSTPPSGFTALYPKADGFWYGMSDGGTESRATRIFVDDDTFALATATNYASAESTKAYVDNSIVALDELAAGDRTVLDTGTPGFVGVDVVLSGGLAGGDTLTGGTAAGDDLILASTAHATRGTVNIRDMVNLVSEDKTLTDTYGLLLLNIPAARTFTLNDTALFNVGNTVQALSFGPTLVFDSDSAAFGATCLLFNNFAIIKNTTSEARALTAAYTLNSAPTYTADTAAVTLTTHVAVVDSPTFGRISTGTLTVTDFKSFVSFGTVGAGATITTRRGLHINDTTGVGTVTTAIGVDIDLLADATTSIGFRNKSTTVHPPPTATNITAVSATIPHNASVIQLTANASYTLTSAPTITDGQDGEWLTIINVDSTDVITIQDQGTLASSNLRLSATTIALGPRDSIVLRYSTTVGDWVQIGQTNVL